jgi:hypothetical protein
MGKYATRRNTLGDFQERIFRGQYIGMTAWGQIAAERAAELAPVDTGRLAREIKVDQAGPQEVAPGILGISFGVSGLEYARAHELGSGIHSLDPAYRHFIEIKPVTPGVKSLAFAWPAGPKGHPAYDQESGMFFFARIMHPGVRPANQGEGYLRLAAKETKEEGTRLLLEAITSQLRTKR